MVLIPQYERQGSIDPGYRVPQVPADTAVPQALSELGNAVSNVGAAFQMRQQRENTFDDQLKRDRHRQDTQEALRQAQQQMPANATGFAQSFLASRKDADEAYIASISPGNRPRYAAEWALDKQSIGDAAAQVEYKARGSYEETQISDALDKAQTLIRSDPSQAPVQAANLKQLVEATSSIPAAAKAEIEKNIDANIATAKFVALYGADPAEARRQLGIPGPTAANPGDYYSQLRQQESGGNDNAAAGTSSAKGRFQFTDGTWAQVAAAHPDLGLTPDGRSDPAQQDRAIVALTRDNEAVLARNGIPINNANRYLAHFMGAGGAVTLISTMQDAPTTPAASIFAAAAKANPTIFYKPDGTPRSVSEVYALQTKRFGGDQASVPVPDAAPVIPGGAPEFAAIPYEQRLTLINQAEVQARQAQVLARSGLEQQVQDASAALLTTGHYDGAMPTAADFTAAYGPARGQEEFQAFQRVAATGQHIDAIKTMTPGDQAALLASQQPAPGPGFADAEQNYQRLQAAVEINQKARAADPVGYVQQVFPAVGAAWKTAAQNPQAFQQALSATAAAEDQIGIPSLAQKLLPDAVAKQAVTTFKADVPEAQRVGAIASTVFATQDPAQQTAIFRQLVDAGLPDMAEGAVRAFARGDQGAADRLMRAVLVDPSKLPGKIAANEASIGQAVQDQIMSAGNVGDLAYGLRFGQAENLVTAERDGKLLTRSVQLRMASGDDLATAIAGAKRDLYGPVQPVQGTNVEALIPETAQADVFEAGAAALMPQVQSALQQAMATTARPTDATGKAIVDTASRNYVDNVMAQGAIRNSAGGNFVFLNPFTNTAVAGPDGKPLVFSLDQIMAAGKGKSVATNAAAAQALASWQQGVPPEAATMADQQQGGEPPEQAAAPASGAANDQGAPSQPVIEDRASRAVAPPETNPYFGTNPNNNAGVAPSSPSVPPGASTQQGLQAGTGDSAPQQYGNGTRIDPVLKPLPPEGRIVGKDVTPPEMLMSQLDTEQRSVLAQAQKAAKRGGSKADIARKLKAAGIDERLWPQ